MRAWSVNAVVHRVYASTNPTTKNPNKDTKFLADNRTTVCAPDDCVGRGELALALLTAETLPRRVLSIPQMFLIEPTRPGRFEVLITSC